MPINNDENKIEISEVETLETELEKEQGPEKKNEEILVSETVTEDSSAKTEKGTEPKNAEKKKLKTNGSSFIKNTVNLSNLFLGLKLCAVVTAVVLVLAFVNNFTAPVIAENQAEKGNIARAELVSDEGVSFLPYAGEIPSEGANVSEIYTAELNGTVIAYCLNIKASGFGGDIDLVVAIGTDLKIRGVKVISHSETVGIGAAALDESGSLLGQFKNLSVASVDSVIAVSGATVTSTAVKNCVEEAVSVVKALEEGAVSQ